MWTFDPGQLRLARRAAGYRLRDAAREAKIAASCISRRENGTANVSANELCMLSSLYGVSPRIFFVQTLRRNGFPGQASDTRPAERKPQ